MAGLPEGEVTFCFTDIEGSTRLARGLGEGWSVVLARHNELLREVWARHGGVEVKTEGDAFFVAFASAAAASAAAVDSHLARARGPWPDGGTVGLRIGLNGGTAEVVGHDYVGVEVHKAARVVAAAHGGQVLLSDRAAVVVAGQEPPGVTLRDLGRFVLKDFDEGERLVQLDHPELDAGPAPRAMPYEAHNLPLLRTNFVGRDVERVEVAKLCEHHRVVTVVGPGGAGKTRLAIEVGRAVARDRPDGTWAVLLAGEPRDSDIAPVVARTLGIADAPGGSHLDAIVAGLGQRRMLLVLDNCEHVLEAAAVLVDRITSACPHVAVLATSRQPLGLGGEHIWTMPELPLPPAGTTTRAVVLESEAVQLFVERAQHANPRFLLTDDTAADVASVCRSVDGLPLALELAAATTRAVPLPALAARLAEGSLPLRSNDPTHAPRNRTTDQLIGWSYDLLDDTQAAVFRRLAVFRGGWTLDAAEAVVGASGVDVGAVLPALADLVERSLVSIDADGRYRMLVLIRAFAETRLRDAGEFDAVATAHVGHYRAFAADLLGGGATVENLKAGGLEEGNLRAAFDRAVGTRDAEAARALYRAYGTRLLHGGHYEELDRVFLAAQDVVEPSEAVHVIANRAQLARARGDYQGCLELCDQADRRLHEVDEEARPGLAAALAAQRVDVLLATGDAQSALAVARRAEALPGIEGARRAVLLETVARAERATGDEAGGLSTMLEAAGLYDELGEPLRGATLRLNVASALGVDGSEPEAISTIETALRLADEAGSPRLRGHALYVSSNLHRTWSTGAREVWAARLADPLETMDEAVEIATQLHEPAVVVSHRAERATVRARAGDMAGAAEDLRACLPAVGELHHQSITSAALAASALVLSVRGDPAAPVLAATALARGHEADDPLLYGRARTIAADAEPLADDEAVLLARARLAADER
jgi:predicted ATPase/class 3 adenylate cyclase